MSMRLKNLILCTTKCQNLSECLSSKWFHSWGLLWNFLIGKLDYICFCIVTFCHKKLVWMLFFQWFHSWGLLWNFLIGKLNARPTRVWLLAVSSQCGKNTLANICCLILFPVSIGNIHCLFFLVCLLAMANILIFFFGGVLTKLGMWTKLQSLVILPFLLSPKCFMVTWCRTFEPHIIFMSFHKQPSASCLFHFLSHLALISRGVEGKLWVIHQWGNEKCERGKTVWGWNFTPG